MKGISIWLFSKIVMLVFLIATFSTVLGFMKLSKDRVSADSAEALAMQIKDAILTTLHTNTLSSKAVVPIPRTLPEAYGNVEESRLKMFTVKVSSTAPTATGEQIIYVAIGWGQSPVAYAAASSFYTSNVDIVNPGGGLSFFSNYSFFVVEKNTGARNTLGFKACPTSDLSLGCAT